MGSMRGKTYEKAGLNRWEAEARDDNEQNVAEI